MVNNKSASVQFKLVKHLITFPAYVNDKGPLDFWLDTGSPGCIISKSLAEELDLKLVDTGKKGIGAGGEVPIILTTVNNLKFAGMEFREIQALVLDLEAMNEKFGHKFCGCIGYELLKNFKVCIDYRSQNLIFIDP